MYINRSVKCFMYVICRSTVFTLERKTPSATDVIRLENSHVVAMVSAETGSLHEVSLKDSGVSVKTDLHFVQYGTRAGKERSGAYLFLPDGAARVCLLGMFSMVPGPVKSAVVPTCFCQMVLPGYVCHRTHSNVHSCSLLLICSGREALRINGTGFCGMDIVSATQP